MDRAVGPTLIAVDRPHFLAFVPAASTQAAVLFDRLVSCSSIRGVFWLLVSGPIAAANQVLLLFGGPLRDAGRSRRLLRLGWLPQQRQPATWARLLPQQQALLTSSAYRPPSGPPRRRRLLRPGPGESCRWQNLE